METVLVNSNGQVTIPAKERKKYGLGPGSKAMITDTKNGLLIQKVRVVKESIFERMKKLADAKKITQADVIRVCRLVGREIYAEEMQ